MTDRQPHFRRRYAAGITAVVASALAMLPMGALAQCQGGKRVQVGQVPVMVAPSRLFFRVRSLALDFDGSPLAYGARDQGQENICVGLAPNSGSCRGQFRGACYQVCRQTFAAWARTSGDPRTLGKTMCSVGLGGGGCSAPLVRLQDPPNSGYFVSETSLKTSPEPGRASEAWFKSQSAQLDPAKIRYIVAPTALSKYGVSYGDVGIAYNAANRVRVPFIVGDCCGLGEASVSLLAALSPERPPQLKPATSALGEPVKRYLSGSQGDFRFVIFAGSRKRAAGKGAVTAIAASGLPQWIEQQAGMSGGATSRNDVMACTDPL